MNVWFGARWLLVTTIGLALTLILMLLAALDAPAGLRTPIAVLVLLGATGFAVVGPARALSATLRWSLVVGLSIAAAFLYAELLVRVHLFTLPSFLWLLVLTQIIGAAVHLRLGRHDAARATERTAA